VADEDLRRVGEKTRNASEQVRRNAEHARQTADDTRKMGDSLLSAPAQSPGAGPKIASTDETGVPGDLESHARDAPQPNNHRNVNR
jgi:hypothetical protein